MEDILTLLRERKGWLQARIDDALAQWEAERSILLEDTEGVRISVDPDGFLVWESFPARTELHRERILPEAPQGQAGPRSLIWLDAETGRQQDIQTLPGDADIGLVVADAAVFLHADCLASAPLLAYTNTWVDTAYPDTRTQHVDLQVLAERELLFVLHREGGVVHIYHLHQRERLASWQIRSPGSSLALNLSFDRGGLKAYLTDNLTPQLWFADLVSLELKLWKSGLGILGNLLAAPEPGCLYLTILKPHFNLVYFELDTMSPRYSVEIRGEPLTSARTLAWDPFMADQETDLLFYLTARVQDSQIQPVLNIIDAEEVRTIKRVALRSPHLPAMLVSGSENPLRRYQQLDFESWLLEQGLIAAEDLAEPMPAVVAPPAALPAAPREMYQPPAEAEDAWERIDQPADFLSLDVAADEVIVDLLCWAFYRLTLTNLRIHGSEIQKLRKVAAGIRTELQEKQAVLAELTGVLGRFEFRTPITRQAVLELLEQDPGVPRLRFEDACPICAQAFAQGSCVGCGYRFELPPDQQLDLSQASAAPADRLLPGQMLIPHPQRPLLLTLNPWRQPVAQLAPVGLKSLTHGVVLPNQHLLAVDAVGNKLVELGSDGEICWKAKLALKKPVMCSYYLNSDELRYLVVDQGNARVLELDPAGRHHRRYPTLKTPEAAKLKCPTHVQLTPSGSWLIADAGHPAVFEVDARGQLLRRFGAEADLGEPILARRLADGGTDIVDRGRGEVLSFDSQGQLVQAFGFWPPQAAEWAEAEAPAWACYLHNGEYLLLGAGYLMLVAPRQQLLRWIGPLPVLEASLLQARFTARTGAELRRQQLAGYAEQLRGIALFATESEESLELLARHVTALSFDAGDWLLHTGELGNALFFVIDGVLDVVAPEKEPAVIFQVRPGESCGTQAVLSLGDTTWRPGIRVNTSCQLLMLERGEFKKAVVNYPRLFSLVRQLDHDHQRLFKAFRDRKTEAAQDKLRVRLNETQIQKFSLFEGADGDFFEALAESVHAVAYLPDQIVCHRGESGGSLFLILEGSVGLLRQGESHPQITLGEGEIFGEMAMILEQPRTATVRTLDYCKFFVLEEPAMRGLASRFGWFWERLETLALERQRMNAATWNQFAARAGLDRPDLPQVLLPAGPRQEEDVLYLPSLYHDALIGLNQEGEVLWFWGREATRQLFHPSRVQPLETSLLVVDTGNHRILEIAIEDRKTLRKWSGGLKLPSAATLTPEGLLLVADTGNQRLVVMDETGREVWQYGLPEEILSPVHVEITPVGTLLFTDAGMHRVYELSLDGQVLWTHGKWRSPGLSPEQLCEPSWAHRLADGSTLIADAGNQRLVWIEPRKPPQITQLHSLGSFRPQHLQRLTAGDWLALDPAQERAIRLNRRGEVIWEVVLQFADMPPAADTEPVSASADAPWVLDDSILDAIETETEALTLQAEAEAYQLEKQAVPAQGPEGEMLFWQEFGETRVAQPEADTAQAAEMLPELDLVLDQVAEDLETISEAEAWSALSHLENFDGLDLGSTLILKAPAEDRTVAAPQEAADEAEDVEDFLDFLMSSPADTGES